MNHARQSAAVDEKSSSVPVREACRLDGTGVIRLVVLDGTNVKVAKQVPSETIVNHLVRMNRDLMSFNLKGQC